MKSFKVFVIIFFITLIYTISLVISDGNSTTSSPSGGGGGGQCIAYFSCPDGSQVNYCQMVSNETPIVCTNNSNIPGFGSGCVAGTESTYCKCLTNPASLCQNPPINESCQNLWYYDGAHLYCQQKQFCGAYMYLGLYTFQTLDLCNAALPSKTNTSQGTFCYDSDGGKNFFVGGYVSTNYNGQDPNTKKYDSCMIPDSKTSGQSIGTSNCVGFGCQVLDYYCDGNAGPYSSLFTCPNGCSYGACLQSTNTSKLSCEDYSVIECPDYCIKTYSCPACPTGQICPDNCLEKCSTPTTHIMCPQDAKLCPDGLTYVSRIPPNCDFAPCNPIRIKVSEIITCIFKDSTSENECYMTGGPSDETNLGITWCKGLDSCTLNITSEKDDIKIWKSSCGGYQYTTQDGLDKSITFDCTQGQINSTQILPIETNNSQPVESWFRNAYWQCQDGREFKEGNETSCLPYSFWKRYAIISCSENVTLVTTYGVVKSFSMTNSCYPVEGPTNISNPIGLFNGTITTPSLQCKQDSDCTNLGLDNQNQPIFKCINGYCRVQSDTDSNSDSNFTISLICKDSCPSNGKCYPFGYRKDSTYCSDSGAFINQLGGNSKCNNNFECSSNLCVSNQCLSETLLNKILSWFKRLFGP